MNSVSEINEVFPEVQSLRWPAPHNTDPCLAMKYYFSSIIQHLMDCFLFWHCQSNYFCTNSLVTFLSVCVEFRFHSKHTHGSETFQILSPQTNGKYFKPSNNVDQYHKYTTTQNLNTHISKPSYQNLINSKYSNN